MILIGTDDGIYRWFDGCGWPIFHSLQGRVIVSLASPGAGLIAAIDRDGTVLESVNNGMDWQVVPGPRATGTLTPATLAVWGEPETIVLATKPLGLYRRVIGAPLPRSGRQRRRPDRWARPGPAGRGALPRGRPHCSRPADRPAPARPIPVWTALGTPEVARGKVASGRPSAPWPTGAGFRPPGSPPSAAPGSGGASTRGQPGSNAPACPTRWSPSGPSPPDREPSSRRPPTAAASAPTTARPGRTAAPAWKTPATSPRSRSSPTTPTSSSPAPRPAPRCRRGCPRRGTAVRTL